jgi:hypothetical protein
MAEFFMIVLIIIVIAAIYALSKLPSEANESGGEKFFGSLKWGELNTQIVCPHCQTKGYVHLKSVKRKKGISGGKATAAIFTLGVSMLATGLSRKEGLTQAHCANCNSTWDF